MQADPGELERIESDGCADWFRAAPEPLRARHRIDVTDVGGARCFRCLDLAPAAMFRRAEGLGVHAPATEAGLDRVIRHMGETRQRFAVTASPHAQPAELPSWLEARGFRRGYAWMKFARDCAAPLAAPTDLDVREIGPEHAVAFARTIVRAFEFSPETQPWYAALPGRDRWVCVAAFDRDALVGAGAVYVDGGCAWLGFGATLESHRRRGAQNAMLALRLRVAAQRGAHTAAVETGERVPDKPDRSYRNILRAGFRERFLRQNWMSREAS